MTPTPNRSQLRAVLGLAALSGASGLTFELVWVREASLLLGHTAAAMSAVVAAFLGGLGLGALALGRRADRARSPLALYGALEVVVAVSAAALTLALPRMPGWLEEVGLPGGGPWAVRVSLAVALVLVPSMAMGGTLPALVRVAVAMDGGSTGRRFGAVYAVNTLGAAAGCLLAGFVVMGEVGIARTGLLAALGNLVAGVVALAWGKKLEPTAPHGVSPEAVPPARGAIAIGAASWPEAEEGVRQPGTDPLPPEPLEAVPLVHGSAEATPTGSGVTSSDARAAGDSWRPMALAAAAGFAALSLEVLWFRSLASALDSTSYALSLLLAVYLSGLVAGAWIFARRPAPAAPLQRFGQVELLFAFAALGSLLLLGQLRAIEHLVPLGAAPATAILSMALRAAAVILLPCVLAGLALPLLVEASSRGGDAAATSGRIYGANTAGGILGSLLTGLWLIPSFGSQPAFSVACAVAVAAALGAVLPAAGAMATREWRAVLVGAVALELCLGFLPRGYLVRGLTHFSDSRTIDVREGVDGTLAVLEYDRASTCASGLYACDEGCPDFRHRQLLFGATSYASTVLPARRYMSALGHLPMLLHPSPADALVICFGTGTTAAAVAAHDALRSLTLVDLNADVFQVADDFRDVNGGVLGDPRVRAEVDDARHFLATTQGSYDVIAFEPPPPRSAGAVDLYTRDFYALVKRRLRPGGVVAQWIPLGQQSDALSRSLVGAMVGEFAHATLWVPARLDAIVLASDAPLDPGALAARWPVKPHGSLVEVGLDRPESLLGTFVAGTEALRRYSAGAPDLTDDRPLVELFLSADQAPFDGEQLIALVEGSAPGHEALRSLLRAHLLAQAGVHEQARAQVEQAEQLSGANRYTGFLRAMEYGCLRPAR